MTLADEITAFFGRRGATAYFGEPVSMTEHSLQAAYFAQANAAPPALVIAALLHDVGHLIDDVPDDLEDWKIDARHEEVGSRWLASRFPPAVSEPVRLHVPAKRYLCATESAYFAKLSDASVVTLKLQGVPCRRPRRCVSRANLSIVKPSGYDVGTTPARWRAWRPQDWPTIEC